MWKITNWIPVIALAAALGIAAKAQNLMKHSNEHVQAKNKQIVRASFDAWRDGTGSVFDLLEPDATWTITGTLPISRIYLSRQEFLDVVIKPFNARLAKPLVPHVRAVYADGDVVIASFDANAVARDGRPYHNEYTWYLQMRDGRVINVIASFDTIEFTDLWTRVKPELPRPVMN